MMSAVLALLAAAALPQPADDPDLRCVAAISYALGTVTEDKSVDAEGLAGLTAIFMYYLGKVDVRRPEFAYARELPALMNEPGYEKRLPADLARCGKEAEERGTMLEQLGEEMKRSAPLTTARPG